MGASRRWWKADHVRSEVREVEGEAWPGRDSEGDVVFKNTHFVDRESALAQLEDEAAAGVSLAGRAVVRLQDELRRAYATAGQEAARFLAVRCHVRESRRAIEAEADAGPSGAPHSG